MSRYITINYLDPTRGANDFSTINALVQQDGVFHPTMYIPLLQILPLEANIWIPDPGHYYDFQTFLGQGMFSNHMSPVSSTSRIRSIPIVTFDSFSPNHLLPSPPLSHLLKGTYAHVYGAKAPNGTPVAVKILDLSAQPQEVQAVAKEIRILQTSSSSPFQVQLINAYSFGTKIWIVMEHCPAGSLEHIIQSTQPFHEDTAAMVIKMILYGLLFLHQNRQIHRDIKPANILVDSNGVFKLADFGLTAVLEKTLDNATSLCGTPYFVSPEVCKQTPYNTKTDVWSLGILLYYILTGNVPAAIRPLGPQQLLRFIPNSMPHHYELPGKPSNDFRWTHNSEQALSSSLGANKMVAQGHGWSPEVKDFLRCCLHHDPTKRWDVCQLLQHCYIFKIPRLIQVPKVVDDHIDLRKAEIKVVDIPNHKAWPCKSNYPAISTNIKPYLKLDDYGFGGSVTMALKVIPNCLQLSSHRPISHQTAQAIRHHGHTIVEAVFGGLPQPCNSQEMRNKTTAEMLISFHRAKRANSRQQDEDSFVKLDPPATKQFIPAEDTVEPNALKRHLVIDETPSKQQKVNGTKSPNEAYNCNATATASGTILDYHQAHNQIGDIAK